MSLLKIGGYNYTIVVVLLDVTIVKKKEMTVKSSKI